MSGTGDTSKRNRGPAAAAENRRALIHAARELFAERGFAVPFSAIARRAGVGQASLYRHFPDKVAIGIAVFDENLALLEGEHLRMREFLERIADQARASTSLLEALVADRSGAAAELQTRLRAIIGGILDRERAEGALDARVSVDDAVAAVSMVAFHVAATPDEGAAAHAIRLIERGLMPRP
ncbi:MAG TPA: helix-turn-helix domain-containing protein [Microbacterium sp.]|nr:helix-turn-helix domain-containing protein [Microbacterium sp.]